MKKTAPIALDSPPEIHKKHRVTALLESLSPGGACSPPSPFEAFFLCFNRQAYYEAHDVLEQLWLQERDSTFYKGLIQLAGAYVHLQKQFQHPSHPKHGRRLRPAARLFQLAIRNLAPHGPFCSGVPLHAVLKECNRLVALLEASQFTLNPWSPASAPTLPVPGESPAADKPTPPASTARHA